MRSLAIFITLIILSSLVYATDRDKSTVYEPNLIKCLDKNKLISFSFSKGNKTKNPAFSYTRYRLRNSTKPIVSISIFNKKRINSTLSFIAGKLIWVVREPKGSETDYIGFVLPTIKLREPEKSVKFESIIIETTALTNEAPHSSVNGLMEESKYFKLNCNAIYEESEKK